MSVGMWKGGRVKVWENECGSMEDECGNVGGWKGESVGE
jgi:hypothetical protein